MLLPYLYTRILTAVKSLQPPLRLLKPSVTAAMPTVHPGGLRMERRNRALARQQRHTSKE